MIYGIADQEGVVSQVWDSPPELHPSIVVYQSAAMVVGDYIDLASGNNVGQRPSDFHNIVGGVWVEDTEAAQEAADAAQAQQQQQAALEQLGQLGGASKLIFAAYNSANSSSFTTTETPCNLNVETYNPDGLVLSGGVISLPIVTDAIYKVSYEGTLEMTASNSRSRATEKIQLDTGSGFVDVAGTIKRTYHREINEGSDVYSTTAIVNAGSNTTLDIQLVASRSSGGGSAFIFLGDSCQVEVWRIA